MAKLLIVSDEAEEYRALIEKAQLPGFGGITSRTTDDCDIVLGEPKLIRDALPLLPNLKWVQAIYAGVESLMDPELRRDYIITNARGVFGELMSEYVFGYLLAHEKKIFERHQSQQSRKWDRTESGFVRGKTIGLLGVGSIGAHLAGTAKHFGMTVRGFTRGSETSTQVDRYYHPAASTSLGLDTSEKSTRSTRPAPLSANGGLIAFATGLDYLVTVLPRTNDTNKIVDANLLNALPSHAVFINVGRGNAVDESALVDALEEGKIAGAVLDVTEKEPLPEAHSFWTTPNLLLTFHTSAISYPADISKIFIENYHLYIEGKPLKYQVDFERGY